MKKVVKKVTIKKAKTGGSYSSAAKAVGLSGTPKVKKMKGGGKCQGGC